MTTKRIGCRKCNLYSHALGRCTQGMINPRTIQQAKDASKWMGLSYICDKDHMRSKLVAALAKERQQAPKELPEVPPTGAAE